MAGRRVNLPDDLTPMVRQRMAEGLARTRERFLAALEDPGFHEFCLARFRAGEEEYRHRREWLAWPTSQFGGEQAQEFADAVNYEAMALVAQDIRDASMSSRHTPS